MQGVREKSKNCALQLSSHWEMSSCQALTVGAGGAAEVRQHETASLLFSVALL